MEKNGTILSSSWLVGTNDMQQRVPDPSQHGLAEVSAHLFDPMNNDIYNAWSSGLINKVGMSIIENKRFVNPLAEFRKNMIFGNSIQDIACKWGKAHSYKDDSEALLKYSRPEFVSAFVSTDRWDTYEVSITRPEIRQALNEGEGSYALNSLIDTAITANCLNPEAYDEMNIMLSLFATHDQKHGIFRHQLTAAPTDKASGQAMLAAVKKYVNRFRFPSTLYNAQDVTDVPCFEADERKSIILTTPDVLATLDVYAFADLFNVSRAEVRSRVIMVPELPFAGAQAILTTEDIFLCANSERGMYEFWDPSTLTTKSFYQIIGQYGINPFAPCVLITTDDATTVATITEAATGLSLTAADDTAAAGSTVQLAAELTGTITDNADGIVIAPDSVTYTVAAHDADGEGVALNGRTYVDRFNVLHIQKSGLSATDVIDVVAVATYVNPSGATASLTDSVEITIS